MTLLVVCFALMLGIVVVSPTNAAYAEGGTPITELTISGLTDADVPQIGKTATLPALTVNTGLKLNHGYGVYWFSLNTRQSLKDTDTFESGFTYALRVQYSVLDGYDAQITDPTKIRLDGVTTPYRVEIDTNAFINFIFNALGNEELSLVNPDRLQLPGGYVGAFATTDAIHVKGGKYPYQFTNIQNPTWLPYTVLLDNGNIWEISFYGYRPTTPTPAQVLSFTVTDADGNSKTFTGTTGETKENPDGIANIVVNYNLPDVGATSPTSDQIKSAITLPPNVVCTNARIYKTDEYTSTDPFTFERWGKYTLRLNLETKNGKAFAGKSLLNGYLVSDNNFSYDTIFGNVEENSLVLDFNITKYGVSLAEQDNYKMTTVNLKKAKVGVPYNEKIEFVKPSDVADSDIKIQLVSDLYGLTVNADGTITGTPDDRVYYNWGSTTTIKVRYVCKGYVLDYKEYQLVVEGFTQISAPSGKTLGYNGSEQVGVEEGEGYTLSGVTKATDLGTYKATAKLNPGYAWGYGADYGFSDREITWKIVKGDRPAPTGITTEQVTVEGKSDGKILGVSTDMEYYDYSTSKWKDCIGGTIENLPAGRYGICYKSNANYNSSEQTIVEITNKYRKSDFKITTASLPNGKCGVDYNAKIEVSCPTGDLSKVKIKNYSETDYKVYGLNLAQDGTISGKPDKIYGDGQQNVEWKIEYYYDDILMEEKSFFLDIEGYTVIALFQGKQNLIYDGSEQVGVEEGEGYTLSGTTKATDAGDYVATAQLKPGYRWDTTNTAIQFANHPVKWSIAKANKDAPDAATFTVTAPTAEGANDGKITGVDTSMEYRVVGGTFADCPGAEIAGLAKGQYEVRYKETKNYKASASATITIAENETTTYNVKVNNGTGGGQYVEGASVTITANTPAVGKRFAGWTIEGISGLDTTKPSITFNMPANAVTATANYEIITYNVSVEKGTATLNKAKYQENVTVTANAPEVGKEFDKWVVTGITLSNTDLTSSTLTFQMPENDVTFTATYKDVVYRVTVIDGTATLDMATYQTEVTVTANAPAADMYFDKWEVRGLTPRIWT